MSLKNSVKRKIYSGNRIDADTLYNEIRFYQYVSFDLFDTLVKRNIEDPTDIFSIMEKTLGFGFKKKRIEAERKARIESGKREVSLEDIYSYFPEAERSLLINMELETELKSIVPNQSMGLVYKKCLEAGKVIYITSDMYWPEEAVRTLLKKNGFSGYNKIFLSSTFQNVKSDGSLFRCLFDSECIKPSQLVHVGDSIRSDYIEPKKLGVKAVIIPRLIKNVSFRGDNDNSCIEVNYLNHFINNTIPNSNDPYYQFGYSQFGKLLYGYVHWIHDEAVNRGINKIFFFSRDGYIMKQAYEACINDKSIETKYLEVSRRSLRVPILWMSSDNDLILDMVVNAKLINLESVFDGLGLEIESYKDAIERRNLKRSEIFDRSSIKNDTRLKGLIEDIKTDIIENSKKEYEFLIKYLETNKVHGKFAVVDIGYGGSMQRYLQQVLAQLKIDCDISGFYLAVADFYTKNMLPGVKLDLNGYLFDFQHDYNAVDNRRSFVGLLETLFLEQGGSVKRYVDDGTGNAVVAERYPYEYEVDSNTNNDLKIIRKIQAGAIDFVKQATTDKMLEWLRCNPNEYFAGLQAVGENPSIKDLELFGDISFYDEGMTEKLAAPKTIVYYAGHPKQMKDDFLKCRWKTGFLKRLLKINLPYQKIYEKLRSFG